MSILTQVTLMPASEDPISKAREEHSKIVSLVLTARRLLAGGTLVDVHAIEERVRSYCDDIATLPRDEARSLLDDMQELVGKLDQLGEDLKGHLVRIGASPAEPASPVEPRSHG